MLTLRQLRTKGGAPVASCLQRLHFTVIVWQHTCGVLMSSVSQSRLMAGLLGTVFLAWGLMGIGSKGIALCFLGGFVLQHLTYIAFSRHSIPTVPAGRRIKAIIIGILVTYSLTFSANVVSIKSFTICVSTFDRWTLSFRFKHPLNLMFSCCSS